MSICFRRRYTKSQLGAVRLFTMRWWRRRAPAKQSAQLNKKVLLVITDGQDNMSQETLQEAIRKLQPNKGATLYAIGLTDEGLTRAGREALQSLATSTGGVAFFPQSLDDVDSITRAVAHDIRSQYTLAYKPAALRKGIPDRSGWKPEAPKAQQLDRAHAKRLLSRRDSSLIRLGLDVRYH